ncbi:MAG: carbon-nitrogen hydrolase [candidate division Zixibacteria bacterium]|nr:carbon-nitrogen hydrolase [candidate division Zixibacteria bacterium]
MKTGFVQFRPILGDVNANVEAIDRLVRSVEQVDLLVLPELCTTGYNFDSKEQAWELSEPIHDGTFVKHLVSLCREKKMHIVAGINERDGDKLYNSAVLVGPTGVVGKYRKLHLFMNEKDIFQPGDLGLPVFDLGWARIGLLICFDWIFPEVWRILALEGADIICHPSNLVIPGLCQRAVPINALINRMYVVTANRIGAEGDLTFTGLSVIADPKGEVIAQASPEDEEVAVVDIDVALARDKMITPRNHLINDRRPQEYRRLMEP